MQVQNTLLKTASVKAASFILVGLKQIPPVRPYTPAALSQSSQLLSLFLRFSNAQYGYVVAMVLKFFALKCFVFIARWYKIATPCVCSNAV